MQERGQGGAHEGVGNSTGSDQTLAASGNASLQSAIAVGASASGRAREGAVGLGGEVPNSMVGESVSESARQAPPSGLVNETHDWALEARMKASMDLMAKGINPKKQQERADRRMHAMAAAKQAELEAALQARVLSEQAAAAVRARQQASVGGQEGAEPLRHGQDGHMSEKASRPEQPSGTSAADDVRGVPAGAEGHGELEGSEGKAKLIEIEEGWVDDPAGEEGWGETVRRRAKYEGVVDAPGRTRGAGMTGGLDAIRRPGEGAPGKLAPTETDYLPVVGASVGAGNSGHLPSGEWGGAQGRGGEAASLHAAPHESAWSLSFKPGEGGAEASVRRGRKGWGV